MELRHLRYFAAVAETRHFGRAAERLHLAQPALSQSVRQLEAELGVSLFTRTTRQVQLTPAGEFLHREARRVLAAVDDSARGVRRIADGKQGLVRIAFTGTAANTWLPRIARLIKAELPGVALEIHADLLTPAQLDGLDDGHLDLGVLRPPVGRDGITTRTITRERLVAVLPADHRLVDEPGLAMSDLRVEPFVMYADSHSAVNEAVLRSCRDAGFIPHREHEAPGTAVLLALVAAGLGVALAPESVQASPLRGVVFREVPDAATTDLALAWRTEDASPLVASILGVLDADRLFDTDTPDPAEALP
ncbi:MAG: LysR substrate-binding domain-containing protein [Nocardioides sp.]